MLDVSRDNKNNDVIYVSVEFTITLVGCILLAYKVYQMGLIRPVSKLPLLLMLPRWSPLSTSGLSSGPWELWLVNIEDQDHSEYINIRPLVHDE